MQYTRPSADSLSCFLKHGAKAEVCGLTMVHRFDWLSVAISLADCENPLLTLWRLYVQSWPWGRCVHVVKHTECRRCHRAGGASPGEAAPITCGSLLDGIPNAVKNHSPLQASLILFYFALLHFIDNTFFKKWKVYGNLTLADDGYNFLAIKHFWIKVCAVFLKHNAIWYLIEYSVV